MSKEPIYFTSHEHDGEWRIRIHTTNGVDAASYSLCTAKGEEEADLIVRSLNLVCLGWAFSDLSATLIRGAWEEYLQ